jgi:FkbM family methyltransferase
MRATQRTSLCLGRDSLTRTMVVKREIGRAARPRRWVRRTLRRRLAQAIRLVPSPVRARARELGREAIGPSPETPEPAVFALSHGETRFKLHVVGEAAWAYGVYARWADGVEVFELVMLECLTRLLRQTKEPAFMDVGAFMGHYACYAAALLGDEEPTYAVESNPDYCAGIMRSIELNGFSSLKPFNAVLSDRIEHAEIEEQTVRIFDVAGGSEQTVTLDELCQRERIEPKIMKIDVHGSEGKVLMGMQELMRRSVEYMLLELHPIEVVREYSGQIGAKDILALLWRLGFHVFHVAGHRYRGSAELAQALREGFAYRRLDADSADLLLLDRPLDVLLLCSREADVTPILGPPAADPGLTSHAW